MSTQMHGIIPVIDLAPLRGGDVAARRSVAAEIDRAFTTVGFCYVRNHGVPQPVIDAAFAAAEAFYQLPASTKNDLAVDALFRGYTGPAVTMSAYREYAEDGGVSAKDAVETVGGKELFNFSMEGQHEDPDSDPQGWTYGPNQWPGFMPEFRTALYAYYEAVSGVGDDLLRGVALAMGADEDFFLRKYVKNTGQCTVLHYPPLSPDEVAAGVESSTEHCDFSCITVLYQDNVGGLQVIERSSGEWIDAPPVHGTFVINVGDMLARWTNHRYVSTPHRVMNLSGRERYSIGTFYNPEARAAVDPRDLGVADDQALYPPVFAGRYVRARFEELYALEGSYG